MNDFTVIGLRLGVRSLAFPIGVPDALALSAAARMAKEDRSGSFPL
jgi:hypothetical protein